ncbi:MAG: tRNA CCA-pyrophosphorylase [Desulfobacteraceae bacterium]|nr:MAG: tRNA CCA-pyrophosphorylase [Desulfobacteraceae bacterium]
MKTNILNHTYEEYMDMLKSFHGYAAPGLIIGGFMVDKAVRNLPSGILYDAFCETRSCLPDAIQLLTPCTIGNGWLKIIDFNRYALSLYDKQTYAGVRVFVDAEKIKAWPEIKSWFFKLKSSKEQDQTNLIQNIREAGAGLLSMHPVRIQPEFAMKKHKGKIEVCPQCREPYPVADGDIFCLACQEKHLYYSK